VIDADTDGHVTPGESLAFDPAACGLHPFAPDESVTWRWGDDSVDDVVPPSPAGCSSFGCAVHEYAEPGRFFVSLVESHTSETVTTTAAVLVVVVESLNACAWERSGFPEASPVPCSTPAVVAIEPTPVPVVVRGTPTVVCSDGCVSPAPGPTPTQDVRVVNASPLAVVATDEFESAQWRSAVVLGLGLVVFLGSIALVTSWRRRRA
jgi:hypothetical protein